MIKCVLWGGYGWGNVGDELTLAVALRDMKTRFGESVAVLSHVPGYTKALFPDAKIIPYSPVIKQPISYSLPARMFKRLSHRFKAATPPDLYDAEEQLNSEQSKPWAEMVTQCKLLYLVGGGYLTDLFNFDFNLLPVTLATKARVMVETAPLGIGPFKHSWNANRFGAAFCEHKIRVRDIDSKMICQNLGVAAELQKDDGFRVLEVVDVNLDVSKAAKLIGVNYFHQYCDIERERNKIWWRDLLLLLKNTGLPIEGFCFHNEIPTDLSQTGQLFEDTGLSVKQVRFPDWDFRDACRRLSNYSVIITTRFHAAVVAGVAEIPTIAVANGKYYCSKMNAACQGHANSRFIEYKKMEPSQVVEIVRQLIS